MHKKLVSKDIGFFLFAPLRLCVSFYHINEGVPLLSFRNRARLSSPANSPAADQVLLEERFTPGQPVQTLWPLADHLGTARVILHGAGLVLSRLTYDSFGNLVNVPAIAPTFTGRAIIQANLLVR